MLINAINRTLAVANEIGTYAMIVDAIDDSARMFYEHFGFRLLREDDRQLFLPIKSIDGQYFRRHQKH